MPKMELSFAVLPQAGDILFVDATSNLDRQQFFRLLTCSPVGGLPLGYLVVSSEIESVLTLAFNLYKSLLPSYAFNNRGPEKGPQVILTDDADSEINALR